MSLKITEDAIEFSNEGEIVGKLYKRQMDPENIATFSTLNYAVQGTVKYDAWIAGAFAGLSLLLGEHIIGPEDRQELEPTVELTGDGSGETISELLPGEIVVPGHTVHNFQPVQSIDSGGVAAVPIVGEETGGLTPPRSPEAAVSETIVPSGETIVPVSESPAGELGGLTPPRSPESDPAGAASP